MAISADMMTRVVSACDICGHTTFKLVANRGRDRNRTVMCEGCGLFFASPAIALDRLNQFYDEEFEGDPSSPKRIADGSIDEASVRKERARARQWALPIIQAHLDPAGRSILDIRARTGGLAKELAEAGAIVTAIDPMAASVRHMAETNQIEAIAVEPSDLDSLAILGDRQFDAISLLTIHTLAHLSSPSRFVARLYKLLKPGGYIFLDEKDVLHPARLVESSVFASGEAHFYHFTAETLMRCLEQGGFEVVDCRHDAVRRSAFRHLILIARKPAAGAQPNRRVPVDTAVIARRLRRATLKLAWLAPYNRLVRATKSLLGKKSRRAA